MRFVLKQQRIVFIIFNDSVALIGGKENEAKIRFISFEMGKKDLVGRIYWLSATLLRVDWESFAVWAMVVAQLLSTRLVIVRLWVHIPLGADLLFSFWLPNEE